MVLVVLIIVGFGYLYYRKTAKQKDLAHRKANISIIEIENVLSDEVGFYKRISNADQRDLFKQRVFDFILNTKFTNVGNATHTFSDKVLVSASAVIPLYHFPTWSYRNVNEILLYEDNFDENHTVDEEHPIEGMIGTGYLNHTMLLSLTAIRDAFKELDGNHTPIHEFVHLIDKADGSIDGIPEYLIPKELIKPWVREMRRTIIEIEQGETQINMYAATDETEFFAVVSEYFFEKPKLLSREHPVLYNLLRRIYER